MPNSDLWTLCVGDAANFTCRDGLCNAVRIGALLAAYDETGKNLDAAGELSAGGGQMNGELSSSKPVISITSMVSAPAECLASTGGICLRSGSAKHGS